MTNNADIALSKAMGGYSAELNPSSAPHSCFHFVTEFRFRFPGRFQLNENICIKQKLIKKGMCFYSHRHKDFCHKKSLGH